MLMEFLLALAACLMSAIAVGLAYRSWHYCESLDAAHEWDVEVIQNRIDRMYLSDVPEGPPR